MEPWKLVKEDEKALDVAQVIFLCAESLRIVGILLQPFMPSKSAKMLDMLGVDVSRRSFRDASFRADTTFGQAKVPVGQSVNAWDTLFPPLPVED